MASKTASKIIALAAACALACAALFGCTTQTSTLTDAQTANRSYMSQVNQKMEDLGDELTTFIDAVSRVDVVTMRTQVDTALKSIDELSAIEAPENLADIHTQYVEGANKLKSALDKYVTLYTDIEEAQSSATFDWATYSDRIAEVQSLYDEGVKALEEADKAASELN